MILKYKSFFKYLIENSEGEEGSDWVRPGSDLDPGMEKGKSNFPYGQGYPNYKPKKDDLKDYEEVVSIDRIIDVDYEHSFEDDKKRTEILLKYIKTKMSDFYKKFQSFIDKLFNNYSTYGDIHHWLSSNINFAKTNPEHHNVEKELKNIEITDEDINILKEINDLYYKLYHIIYHRDDPQNERNYPLYVTLYDIIRAFGGYEEGGWYYDKYEFVSSIEIKSPSELEPAAEKLYANKGRTNGKPVIVVEKQKNSQDKNAPEYS